MTDFRLCNVGEAIRELREVRGVSSIQLSNRLGWSEEQLRKHETNQVEVTVSTIDKIAEVLHLEPKTVLMFCLRRVFPDLAIEGSSIGTKVDRLCRKVDQLERVKQ